MMNGSFVVLSSAPESYRALVFFPSAFCSILDVEIFMMEVEGGGSGATTGGSSSCVAGITSLDIMHAYHIELSTTFDGHAEVE